jgi:hypothetical protein
MRRPTSERRTRPDKFPLTLHKTGQYCKKIEGKMYYFGADRPQALAPHLEQAAWLHSGRLATYWSAAGQLWAKTMCNLYLNHQESRVPVGQSPATACHGIHHPAAADRRRLVRIHDLRLAPSAGRRAAHREEAETKRARAQETSKSYLWMREVRVRRADGRQTAIVTSRQDLPAGTVAGRIFCRWRQENHFEYMDEESALDALL